MATIDDLVVSTTGLLAAVNVAKATLDSSVVEATTAAAAASTDRTLAETAAATSVDAKNTAAAAAASAVAVVSGGTASLTPAAGKIPIADANGLISPAWLPAAEMDYVGVAYNPVTATWKRLGSAVGWPVGTFPGVQISPIFKRLRRVVLKDDGTVFKGISWLDFTRHDDGTTVDLTGATGQIMVEYLPSYYRTYTIGDWQHMEISHLPLPGFTLHPLFVGKSAAYRGAYEASVYGSKLCSIAKDPIDGIGKVFPVTTRAGAWGNASLTTAATDSLALARGTGWRQSHLLSAMYERLLMLVGFASYNIPGIVGAGRISLSSGLWENDSYIGATGLGDVTSGFFSANSTAGSAGFLTAYSQCLGIENSWGNVWERVAALVSDGAIYYGNPPYNYTTVAGFTRLLDAAGLGINLPTANGYAGKPHSGLGLALPADVTGSSSAGMFDYYYYASGLRVPLVGGYSDDGAAAGPVCWGASGAAAYAGAELGGRLCFERNTA